MNNISLDTQKLLEKAKKSNRYFVEFTKVHAAQEHEYIVCIEGNDQPYYETTCKQHLDTEKVYFIRCNGKDNVIKLIDILVNSDEESYRISNCFGIVDFDYGLNFDNIYSERIYETPYYSFENFYLSKDFISKVVSSYFNVKQYNDFSEDYERIIENYLSRLNEFINIIKEVDEKYRATQISKHILKEGLPSYSSSNISLSPICINLKKVYFRNNTSINDCFKEDISNSYSSRSLEISAKSYQHDDIYLYRKSIRGKFLIHFLYSYLSALKQDVNDLENSVCFKQRSSLKKQALLESQFFYKIHLSFDKVTILSVLSQYADRPPCLKTFLVNFKSRATSMVA